MCYCLPDDDDDDDNGELSIFFKTRAVILLVLDEGVVVNADLYHLGHFCICQLGEPFSWNKCQVSEPLYNKHVGQRLRVVIYIYIHMYKLVCIWAFPQDRDPCQRCLNRCVLRPPLFEKPVYVHINIYMYIYI